MRSAIIVLILGLTASSVMSACADANYYTKLVGYTDTNVMGSGDTAADATAATAKCGYTTTGTPTKLCLKDLAAWPTAVQTYTDTVKGRLEDLAGKRDQYFIDQRGDVIKVLASLRRLNELVSDASIPSSATAYVTLFGGFATEISKNFTAIVANLESYQTSRASCMDQLLQTQAAIICASAIDGFATGVVPAASSGTATIDDAILTTLTSTCYSYLENSATQSSIIYTNLYGKVLTALVSAVEKLINNDSSATTDFATAISEFSKVTVSSTNYQIPVQKPTACTSASAAGCIDWVESNFFGTDGKLNEDNLITAGNTAAITFSRRLEGNERRLAASGGYVVDLTKYSFTTGFEENPGNVDNTKNANSALRNGIVACAVAALALVF